MMFMLISLFFFFFTQKTAYELRISDWSSDVCSADRFILARGFELALDSRYEAFDPCAVDRALVARDLDAAHQFLAIEGLARPAGLEHRDFAELDAFEGGEARAAILTLTAATDRRARSEAHTSELQSLMRRQYL